MNNYPGRGPGPRPPWPRRARVAAASTVMAAALLTAACSGSPSPTGSGGSPSAGGSASSHLLAYSRCVRSHGVPNFPDPDSSGQIPKEAVVRALREVSDSRAKAATNACANLAPAGLGPAQAPITAQEQQYYLRAAACMRSHGFTTFPDPIFSNGTVNFPIPSNIDSNSTRFTQARQTCERLIPAGLPDSGRSGG
jgi:hypothetical protein